MKPLFRRPDPSEEFLVPERCWILRSWNDDSDPGVSIARARVEPGVTTQLHRLAGVAERYVIVSGTGTVRIGRLDPIKVAPGDVVVIPADTPQQIANDGAADLVFYCICTPRFFQGCYENLE